MNDANLSIWETCVWIDTLPDRYQTIILSFILGGGV